jgi:hypothetical protein
MIKGFKNTPNSKLTKVSDFKCLYQNNGKVPNVKENQPFDNIDNLELSNNIETR